MAVENFPVASIWRWRCVTLGILLETLGHGRNLSVAAGDHGAVRRGPSVHGLPRAREASQGQVARGPSRSVSACGARAVAFFYIDLTGSVRDC
jgi:hypothetical protein